MGSVAAAGGPLHNTSQAGHFDRRLETCEEHLPSIVPRGIKIRLIRWDQDHLHNRFILTDSGGLKFSHGLDEHNSRPPKHDIVDLLEQEPYQAMWKEYQRDSSHFPPPIEDYLTIEGIA